VDGLEVAVIVKQRPYVRKGEPADLFELAITGIVKPLYAWWRVRAAFSLRCAA